MFFELGVVNFYPTWHFSPGQEYEVYWKGEPIHSFRIDPLDKPATELLRIYPSADTLPSNTLKMYFEFSAPMGYGDSYQYVLLIDHNGDTLDNVFLQLRPELWNEDRTILTLWFDPGRIKRDLGPNQELGAPLVKGVSYTVLVDDRWNDANGTSLSSGMSKTFFVTKDDRALPSIELWEVSNPASNTKDTLSILFNESMDAQLAMEVIVVYYEEQQVEGVTFLEDYEYVWHFWPSDNWRKGEHTIIIEGRFEDLAGNNLNRLFDRDLMDESDMASEQPYFEVSLVVH